jgi:hypothetical protein
MHTLALCKLIGYVGLTSRYELYMSDHKEASPANYILHVKCEPISQYVFLIVDYPNIENIKGLKHLTILTFINFEPCSDYANAKLE